MKKMNNKGFSLVELIIVIAIMAVLIAVLAPQYLKYVEKSRVSADAQTADEFVSALQVIASDPDLDLADTTYGVTSDTNGNITITGNSDNQIETVMDTSKMPKFKSKLFKQANRTIKITYNAANGQWTLTNDCPSVSS